MEDWKDLFFSRDETFNTFEAVSPIPKAPLMQRVHRAYRLLKKGDVLSFWK